MELRKYNNHIKVWSLSWPSFILKHRCQAHAPECSALDTSEVEVALQQLKADSVLRGAVFRLNIWMMDDFNRTFISYTYYTPSSFLADACSMQARGAMYTARNREQGSGMKEVCTLFLTSLLCRWIEPEDTINVQYSSVASLLLINCSEHETSR